MKEFRFLVFVIILIEVGIFACGLRVVYNRHTYRTMFIQLEREQQTYHSLIDELNRAKVELASFGTAVKHCVIGEVPRTRTC